MAISKPPQPKEVKTKSVEQFIKGKNSINESTQISLKLPVKLLEEIDEKADDLSISRAALIKQSCAIFLKNN